ncbi:MAG: single-stranded-DNA-specific exonuclease RecJ [Deltaproteobacteria bacterium]|nr:single-stranded-DNA-specific exonuclease RecJ [Deltaproteobacteria bacterium]
MDAGGNTRKTWGIGADEGDSLLTSEREIQNYLLCHPVVARLLWNRGLRSAQQLDRFLKPELSQLPDPFSIIDMEKAVSRVAEAIVHDTHREERIAVYGDYDVDGTCGSSLLVDFFKSIGVEVVPYQPNRFSEGYGVHVAAVEKLAAEGAKIIITVDCGITAVAPAKRARELGVDLIVIDHHKVGAELPDALAVVDPQRSEDSSGLLNVCGAGLAFFFAAALRAKLRELGFFEGKQEPNLVRLLDLVAVATIADVVDVRGVNRILVTHGLRLMARQPRAGIKALLEAAKIEKPTSMHMGFVLGPRINAAGRLKSARAAFDLLTSDDLESARKMAAELEKINTERRATQDDVQLQARAQAEQQLADPKWKELAARIPAAQFGPWPRALVLAPPAGAANWHEGVVGIVASKIAEEFGRPAFILAEKEGAADSLKGSVRSFAKIDILAAISAASVCSHLTNFGGHAHAGGVALKREGLAAFTEALNAHMAVTLGAESYHRERRFDAEVSLDEIDAKLVEELEKLGPFGHQFPEPVLKLSNVSCSGVKVMKEKHLKLRYERLEAVWFNAVRCERLENGAKADVWVNAGWNEWQGVKRLQLSVRHVEVR